MWGGTAAAVAGVLPHRPDGLADGATDGGLGAVVGAWLLGLGVTTRPRLAAHIGQP
jgi:hypothetical protein